MQRFESWDDVEAFYGSLTPAEKKLKVAVENRQICDLGALPQTPVNWSTPPRRRLVRADILHFIIFNGEANAPTSSHRYPLRGAIVAGELNLMDCVINSNLGLTDCIFQNGIEANRATFNKFLTFEGSTLPYFSSSSSIFKLGISFDNCVVTSENRPAVDLNASQISQLLGFENVKIYSNYTSSARNQSTAVNLVGAKIDGQLNFTGASISSSRDWALHLQEAEITKGLIFKEIEKMEGGVNFTAAYTASLVDDAKSWSNASPLALDGFTYDRIIGETTEINWESRLRWLEICDAFNSGQFNPQPYTQLAKVLKEMGHERDAREIRVALAGKLGKENLKRLKVEHTTSLTPPPRLGISLASFYCRIRYLWAWLLNFMFRNVVGYGFKPAKSIYWLLGLIGMAWFLALGAWQTGQFAPNSAPILVSEDWKSFAPLDDAAAQWSEKGKAGQDWETFNSLAYATDIVIPIVEIGQTSAWAPSKERGPWGATLWWARWVFTAAGWIISALGAAAITGVIRRE